MYLVDNAILIYSKNDQRMQECSGFTSFETRFFVTADNILVINNKMINYK